MISNLAHKIADDDAPLMRRMANKDAAALSDIMTRHLSRIHAAAYRMLGDASLAEDIAQMVFLNLWETAPTWEFGRGSILTYLYHVTSHRCLDILRKSKESLPGELPDTTDIRPGAFDYLAKQDQSQKIDMALGTLKPQQRLAIVLFYYEHQSLKDGAKIMDITPSAFESLLRRARAALKTTLTQDGFAQNIGETLL